MELRSRNETTRQNAAVKLIEQVNAAFRELQSADFTRYYNDVNNRMVTLILSGADTHERTGGLFALNALIDFKGDDAAPEGDEVQQLHQKGRWRAMILVL